MKIAVLTDGVVTEIKTMNSEQEIQLLAVFHDVVDITDLNPMPDIGWVFEGNALVPGPGMTATPSKKITKLALRQRMTFAELCALEAASLTDVRIAALKGNLQVATYVDLNRSDTIGGLGLLVSLGLLTSDRMNTILTTPISDYEKYKGTD